MNKSPPRHATTSGYTDMYAKAPGTPPKPSDHPGAAGRDPAGKPR